MSIWTIENLFEATFLASVGVLIWNTFQWLQKRAG